MDYPNIKIDYRDTLDKFRDAANEVISFLVENLLILNTIEEECSQLNEYLNRGIRIKGMPKDSAGIWSLFKTRCGKAVSSFCTDDLIERGYAQSMNGAGRVLAPDGTLVEEKIYGQYAYLNYGCELAVTMKSSKCAVIEIFYSDRGRFDLDCWQLFTLTNTDKWQLADIKWKDDKNDRWKNNNV